MRRSVFPCRAACAVLWIQAAIIGERIGLINYAVPLRQLAYSMMDASLANQALTHIGPDHQEAVTAFKEKRKPDFRGQQARFRSRR